MSGQKIHINYTAEDIEKYFSGKLSPAVMHDMEEAALNDDFLAEAMEGYEAMKNQQWKKELNEARKKLFNKETKATIIPLYKSFKWRSAVAALLIISCGAALFYRFNNNVSEKNKIADIRVLKKINKEDSLKKNTEPVAVIPPAEQTVTTSAPEKNNNKPLTAEGKRMHLSSTTTTGDVAAGKSITAKPSAINNTNVITDSVKVVEYGTVAAANKSVPGTFKSTEINRAAAQNNAAYKYKEPVLNHTFNAEVIAPDNTPLPFANVSVKQENFGTYADVKGKFRLMGADSLLTIEVRAAGYKPATYTLKSGSTQNVIVLNEMQFAAKDIIKFDRKKTKNTSIENRHAMQLDTVLDVEPADGWSNYNTYLSNNLAPSDEILKKNIHGEVEVSFDVQSNGLVSNVNIAKSLCGDCDEEALRVIKNGPQWKVKKGKKDKGKVKIKF